MENAVEALKMAAAVLTFVLALGISISSFSQAKQTSEIILSYTDRDFNTQYIEDVGTTERIVGKETIIPTIYRAYNEFYKIYFYHNDGTPIQLYTKIEDGIRVSVNSIDSTKDILGSDRQEDNFIMALLYGSEADLKDENGNSISFYEFNQSLKAGNSGMDLNNSEFRDIISSSNSRFLEKFGVYYPNQAKEGAGDGADGTENVDAQTANEMKMRVISYYLQ